MLVNFSHDRRGSPWSLKATCEIRNKSQVQKNMIFAACPVQYSDYRIHLTRIWKKSNASSVNNYFFSLPHFFLFFLFISYYVTSIYFYVMKLVTHNWSKKVYGSCPILLCHRLSLRACATAAACTFSESRKNENEL